MSDETPHRITHDARNTDAMFIAANQIQAVKNPPPIIHIASNSGKHLVSIHPDGRTEFGEDYQPDEAAQAFWNAVQHFVPPAMVREYGRPLAGQINGQLKACEEAERKVQRLDQMAQAWAERLPETLNRDTVVDAIHQVTRGDGQ